MGSFRVYLMFNPLGALLSNFHQLKIHRQEHVTVSCTFQDTTSSSSFLINIKMVRVSDLFGKLSSKRNNDRAPRPRPIPPRDTDFGG